MMGGEDSNNPLLFFCKIFAIMPQIMYIVHWRDCFMDIKVTKIVHYSATIQYTLESKYRLKIRNWMIQPERNEEHTKLVFFLPKCCLESRLFFHEYMEYNVNEDLSPKFDLPDVDIKNK